MTAANARYWVPSENEWYKAAFYKGGGTDAGYWAYPTQSDLPPTNAPCYSAAADSSAAPPGQEQEQDRCAAGLLRGHAVLRGEGLDGVRGLR